MEYPYRCELKTSRPAAAAFYLEGWSLCHPVSQPCEGNKSPAVAHLPLTLHTSQLRCAAHTSHPLDAPLACILLLSHITHIPLLSSRPHLQGDITAGKMIFGVEGVDADRRRELIRLLDIDLYQRLNTMSDGQRRRVQICMGLLKPYDVSDTLCGRRGIG